MAVQVLSKVFTSASGILNAIKTGLPLSVGIPQSIINSENSKYMITITMKNPTMYVTAFLQDKFVFNVSSNWTDAADMSGLFATLSDIAQLHTGHSLMSTIATRRKWRGSSPVNLTIKLKFEAFTDVKREVITPCEILQSIVLPSGGYQVFGEKSSQFLLDPPGPNPFYLENMSGKGIGKYTPFNAGRVTTITIGDFITFDSVIVTSVEVVFESRMSNEGPVGAEATVNFQTYEMLTKEKLAAAYEGIATQKIEMGGVTDTGMTVSPIPR